MSKSTLSQLRRRKALRKLLQEMKNDGINLHFDQEAQDLLDFFARQKRVSNETIYAVTLGNDIFVRVEYAENVRVLREEFIHAQQQQRCQAFNRIVEAEIEARELIIQNRHLWAITNDEVREIIRELRQLWKTKGISRMQTIIKTKIPKAILAKYPELESITMALEQYRSGSLITAKCMKCNGTLVVKDIPTIGTTWVVCDKGCTNYHENYKA